jgi:hypothetical protein
MVANESFTDQGGALTERKLIFAHPFQTLFQQTQSLLVQFDVNSAPLRRFCVHLIPFGFWFEKHVEITFNFSPHVILHLQSRKTV